MKNLNNLVVLIACFLLLAVNQSYSQAPTYSLVAKNFIVPTDNQFEFDIYLQWTNQGASDPFHYGFCQYCLGFNPAADDGQTWTMENIGSDLPDTLQPSTLSWYEPSSQLRYSTSLAGVQFLVSSVFPGTKVIRTRVTSSGNFGLVNLDPAWRNTGLGLVVKITYIDTAGLAQFITNPASHTVDSTGSSLPVELINFSSVINRNSITLNWSTSSEINNRGFELQRSAVNSEWSMVKFIEGAGNSSNLNNYSYTDKNLTSGKYNYRLKQIDFNGNFEYFNLSNEVVIGIPETFNLSQNYPNPFNPTTKINYDLPIDGNVTLIIYDISGREVSTLINENKTADYYSVSFNGSNLASGMYFYRISLLGNGKSYSMTKKMLMVK